LPIVLLVIFVLLYFTYHSALEAAHVLLAVPFALTGGVYLLWMLGYNFSVAVWVGFIALFGTAVQTGVVMVIYLEEAVERKRQELGGTLTRAGLRDAVMEGALLRLRPKVMTVSTVIAGLLPIMWSTRAGAEVMKPLAPVLGHGVVAPARAGRPPDFRMGARARDRSGRCRAPGAGCRHCFSRRPYGLDGRGCG
jgi:Cu(I)/Ag(I) efflux system membrane protein CusA/SilA